MEESRQIRLKLAYKDRFAVKDVNYGTQKNVIKKMQLKNARSFKKHFALASFMSIKIIQHQPFPSYFQFQLLLVSVACALKKLRNWPRFLQNRKKKAQFRLKLTIGGTIMLNHYLANSE